MMDITETFSVIETGKNNRETDINENKDNEDIEADEDNVIGVLLEFGYQIEELEHMLREQLKSFWSSRVEEMPQDQIENKVNNVELADTDNGKIHIT